MKGNVRRHALIEYCHFLIGYLLDCIGSLDNYEAVTFPAHLFTAGARGMTPDSPSPPGFKAPSGKGPASGVHVHGVFPFFYIKAHGPGCSGER